jgi:16S rRNA (uracil1498-N3)-methyltransferase
MKSLKKDYEKKLCDQKHEFALFVESLSALVAHVSVGSTFTITDEKLLHRMMNVLRLYAGDQCIFFDRKIQVYSVVNEYAAKKNIVCTIINKHNNKQLMPQITFLLPLLKRDDFEQALYALTEIGVSTIQLVVTQKGQNVSAHQKDMERAHRIIIAAAEQSKNFMYPELKSPITFSTIASLYNNDAATKIFFDPSGCSLLPIMQDLQKEVSRKIILLIGPEGDLTVQEKDMVASQGFIFCSLTPTILRAVQAAALGAGIVRSLVMK